jgi:hypothetical protein
MSDKMKWGHAYNLYIDILGRVLSGQTYAKYTSDTVDDVKIIRLIAATDAICLRDGDMSGIRSFESLKIQILEYRTQLHLSEQP